jgi:hypothetical protein
MSSSKEAAILAVISFIAVILIYSSVAKFDAFARSKIESGGCTSRDPTKPGATSAKECCWTVTDYNQSGRITDVYSLCQTCEYGSNGNKIDCRDTSPLRSTGGIRYPPSSAGAEQPPSSSTCPNGSPPDANGKCPITTTVNPSQNLASNNTPQQVHHHKGSNNLLGQESIKKGNSSSVP